MNEPDEPLVEIDMETLRQFVNDLRTLEKLRQGAAILRGKRADQFMLSLSIYDRAGHVLLKAALQEDRLDGAYFTMGVSLGFQVDPTALPKILNDFENLLTFPRSK